MAYATTEEFGPSNFGRVLVAKLNGGGLTVSAKVGEDLVVTDTITADGGYPVDQRGSTVVITPSGGATYEYY